MKTNINCTSKYAVSRGVPQGGVLSPTLFNLALISVADVIPANGMATFYADDICLWSSSVHRSVPPRRLQKALHLISQQLLKLGLTLSSEKTTAMAFTKKSMRRYPILLAGHPLPYVKSYKYLGVIVDRNLTWVPEANLIRKKD